MFSKIIDFGLSHSYLKKSSKFEEIDSTLPNILKPPPPHIDHEISDPTLNFKGNMLFSSKYTFQGHVQSRRDDIISIIYILIFLISGKAALQD